MVTDRMAEIIDRWEQVGDRRSIFLGCYAMMTGNMLKGLQAGRFQDAVWVDTLLHHFADYYFEALEAYEQDSPDTPAVWRHAHNAAGRSQTMVLQNLFLGINAHINYDLVLALSDVLNPEWQNLSPKQREVRYADHCCVNQIIATTVDRVQDEVVERYAPVLDLVDVMLGPLDEWVASRVIARWRDAVWIRAVAMAEAPTEVEQETQRQELERACLRRATLMLKGNVGGDTARKSIY